MGFRVIRVACRPAGAAPGRGGRWYFWRCRAAGARARRDLDVVWQVPDPRDAVYVSVNVRDRATGLAVGDAILDDGLRPPRGDVARLFTQPWSTRLNVGDGVISAGCRPSPRDRSGLGNPWRCTLELDSEGTAHYTVRVDVRGGFAAGYAGRGCCLKVRRPAVGGGARGGSVPAR